MRYLLAAAAFLWSSLPSHAQATLSVTPAYAYVSATAPYGAFQLRNEGTQPLEIIVTAQYGVIASNKSETNIHLGSAGLLGDLTDRLTFFPERLIIDPGQERVVRYLVEGAEALPDGGHIALMHFRLQERAAVSDTAVPAIATAISIEYNLVAPLVVISGQGAPKLRAEVLSVRDDALSLLLHNESPFPFVGGITLARKGAQLTRTVTAIYTQRRIDLALRAPLMPGSYVLHFDHRYPGLSRAMQHALQRPEPLHFQY